MLGNWGRRRRLIVDWDHEAHVCHVGPTGAAKTTTGVLQTMLHTHRGSAAVYDVKGQLLRRTWRALKEWAHIVVIDPTRPDLSAHINLLDTIRPGDNDDLAARSLACSLIDYDPSDPRGQYWKESAAADITAAILHVLYARPKGRRNLPEVYDLLRRGDDGAAEMVSVGAHPEAVKQGRAMLGGSKPGKGGGSGDYKAARYGSATTPLAIFAVETVREVTATSDFGLDCLSTAAAPVWLFLCPQEEYRDALVPFSRALFASLGNALTRADRLKGGWPVLLVLDELIDCGWKGLPAKQRLFREYGVRVLATGTSMSGLIGRFGEDFIANFDRRVFYKPNSPEEAKLMAEYMPEITVERPRESKSYGGGWWSPLRGRSVSVEAKTRRLMTWQDLLKLPKGKSCIVTGFDKPIQARTAKGMRFPPAEDYAGGLDVPGGWVSPWNAVKPRGGKPQKPGKAEASERQLTLADLKL